jgi:hypothetical protein
MLPNYNHFAVVFKSCFSYTVFLSKAVVCSRFVVVQSTLTEVIAFSIVIGRVTLVFCDSPVSSMQIGLPLPKVSYRMCVIKKKLQY